MQATNKKTNQLDYLGGVGGFSLKKNSVGSELAVIMIAYQNNILQIQSLVLVGEYSESTKKLGNKNPRLIPTLFINAKIAVAIGRCVKTRKKGEGIYDEIYK